VVNDNRSNGLRASAPASNRPIENALTRIRVAQPNMARSAQRIADFVLAQPQEIVGMSVTDIAEAVDVSEGSIINFCRSIGLSGFQQLKLSLAQELVQPVQFIHEDLEPGDNVEAICRKVFHSGIQALRDTMSVLDPATLTAAMETLRRAKRIEIYGIGSSAPIAEDAHYRMMRIGLDARCDPDVAVLTVSHTGATHETIAATRLAKEAGAKTVVITNFARSPIQAYADIVLFTMARETQFRTEAMASRIAQLCVVDALIAALAMADYDRSTTTLRETFDVLSIKRF
jgi:DNA-binding MurR/RpiR family transcriptional regulator